MIFSWFSTFFDLYSPLCYIKTTLAEQIRCLGRLLWRLATVAKYLQIDKYIFGQCRSQNLVRIIILCSASLIAPFLRSLVSFERHRLGWFGILALPRLFFPRKMRHRKTPNSLDVLLHYDLQQIFAWICVNEANLIGFSIKFSIF